MANPNYQTYLGTALQLQRWRDFTAHLSAYLLVNTTLVAIWLATGRGGFWPAISLGGWGLGLSSQHFLNSSRGPITDHSIRERMTGPADTPNRGDTTLCEHTPKAGLKGLENGPCPSG